MAYGFGIDVNTSDYPPNAMKISQAALFAMITLSVALCACDSGDKKDSGAAPSLPPKNKKPEAPKEDGATANPQPPEPGDAGKGMAEAPPPPAPAMDAGELPDKARQLDVINSAIKAYKAKNTGQIGLMSSGKSIEQLKRMPKPSSGAPITSLDQLVKAGLLTKIPEPPVGKKYVIDATTQEVRLENK